MWLSCAHLAAFLFLWYLQHTQQQMAVIVTMTNKIAAAVVGAAIRKILFSHHWSGRSPASQSVSLKEEIAMSQLPSTFRTAPETGNVIDCCSDVLHEFNSSLSCEAEWLTDRCMRALYVTSLEEEEEHKKRSWLIDVLGYWQVHCSLRAATTAVVTTVTPAFSFFCEHEI